MDPTKDKNLEQMLANLRDSLKIIPEDDHMHGYEPGRLEPGYGAVPPGYGSDTVTLSGPFDSNTVIGGGYSYSALGTNFPNVSITTGSSTSPYTISSGTGINSPWYSNSVSPKIRLDGEGADIEVNGESLIGMIRKIEERLNILHPNEKLEAEWEELRVLGEKYRELEQHIKDKQATWDRLKAMPPPAVE